MSVLFPDNPGTSLGEARFSNYTQEIPEQSPDWIVDIFPNNSFIDSEAFLVEMLALMGTFNNRRLCCALDCNFWAVILYVWQGGPPALISSGRHLLFFLSPPVQTLFPYFVSLVFVRYWDLAILTPNLLFLLFLLLNARHVLKKITGSKSPVFKAFFVLVYLTTFMNVIRCIVSMSISATNPVGELVDK
ncbi:hypothetical protein OSTOST_08357, partial [Ostertagia ostertagi]